MMTKKELEYEIEIIKLQADLIREMQVNDMLRAEKKSYVEFGAKLLGFAAEIGSVIKNLPAYQTFHSIGNSFIELTQGLREIGRLDELERIIQDEEQELLDLIKEQGFEQDEANLLSIVIARNLEAGDIFED